MGNLSDWLSKGSASEPVICDVRALQQYHPRADGNAEVETVIKQGNNFISMKVAGEWSGPAEELLTRLKFFLHRDIENNKDYLLADDPKNEVLAEGWMLLSYRLDRHVDNVTSGTITWHRTIEEEEENDIAITSWPWPRAPD